MTSMFRFSVLGLILSILIFGSCDGDNTKLPEEEVPDTVSENLRQVSVSPNGRVEILADRLETYNEEDYSVFFGAQMQEFTADGEKILEGGAELIEVMGNGDGSASGNVRVWDLDDDSRLEADQVLWNDADRILTGTGAVEVELGDGLSVKGESFVADMARESYVFTNGVEGELVVSDE